MGIDHLLRDAQSPAPTFSPESSARLASDLYGITGVCRPLAGERDRNYRLDGLDGSHHLLKIWNARQDPALVEFQLCLLDHLSRRAPGLPVPRVIARRPGVFHAIVESDEGTRHAACLMTWRPGAPLREAPASVGLWRHLGRTLAALDRALEPFDHPASERDMLWDVSRADRLRELLDDVDDPKTADRAERMLDRFTDRVVPMLASLPRQVIHGDFNLDNVLVMADSKERVSGVIDFGDALRAPRICELAIAGAYQLVDTADPTERFRSMLSAYHDAFPLTPDEVQALPVLIGARLVSSVLITSRMAKWHPGNREYLLIDTRSAAGRLQRLLGEDADALVDRLLAACGLAPP